MGKKVPQMWQQLRKVDVRHFSSNKLKGLEFEHAVVKTMKHIGFELAATKESKDGGVDHQVSTILCLVLYKESSG